ncbi:MAG TPA: hypothetical protein VMZ28_16665 [Kofleriaceae bacterium]|nr:hypothetical protein [Kofleriaceae bacterium]
MSQVLTGTYRTRESAVRAAERLLEAGFTRDEVCLLAPDDRHGSHFAVRPVTSALPGFGGGSMVGLLIGALAAIAYSFVDFPVTGLELLEGQPLLVLALCGAGAGAVAGGVLGALFGAFRTHHEAIVESNHRHAGFMLVGVTAPRNMARSAAELLQISGASKVTKS